MNKRITIFFSTLMILFCFMIIRIYVLSTGNWLYETAVNQNSYRLVVSRPRGLIYDCNRKPLVNEGETELVATIFPSIESMQRINKVMPQNEIEKILPKFQDNKPFKIKLSRGVDECEDIRTFTVPQRYSKDQMLPHVIGYVDENGDGVSGIEASYNDFLKQNNAEVSVRYKVDALGRVLKGEKVEVVNTKYLQTKGVVLTIDKNIQKIAESVSRKFLKKGAVIITEIPDCKVRACVSIPEFSPNDLGIALENKDGPFINRAFSAYNIGSIFKLITGAAALESGIDSSYSYDCCGHLDVDGTIFHCFNGGAHHLVDLKGAITHSCNTYFIKLAEQIKPSQLLDMTKKFNFGKEIEVAPNLVTAKGNLPTISQMQNSAINANVSFGQGPLMVNPLQVSALVNTIASGGVYYYPQIVEGLVNESFEFIEEKQVPSSEKIIAKKTSDILMDSMRSSVENGTSLLGKPSSNGAGAKTATAETGEIIDDHKVIQAWYAGFYPAFNPKYCIVVLAEDGVGGGESCGPVFKEIADNLNI